MGAKRLKLFLTNFEPKATRLYSAALPFLPLRGRLGGGLICVICDICVTLEGAEGG